MSCFAYDDLMKPKKIFLFDEYSSTHCRNIEDNFVLAVMDRLAMLDCLEQHKESSVFVATSRLDDFKRLQLLDQLGYRAFVLDELPYLPYILKKSFIRNTCNLPSLPSMLKPRDFNTPITSLYPFVKML